MTVECARRGPKRRATAAAVAALLMACGDDTGGPPPCLEDAECAPICEANCADDPVESAVCDEFLLTCVCDCAS